MHRPSNQYRMWRRVFNLRLGIALATGVLLAGGAYLSQRDGALSAHHSQGPLVNSLSVPVPASPASHRAFPPHPNPNPPQSTSTMTRHKSGPPGKLPRIEPRPLAGYNDATVYPVKFGRTDLALLAAGGRVSLALAGGEVRQLVGIAHQTLRGNMQTITVTVDGWPGIFTLGEAGFFGSLSSADGNLMLQGNSSETLALDPIQLRTRRSSQSPDYRHAPRG